MPRKTKNVEDSIRHAVSFCCSKGIYVEFTKTKVDQYSHSTKTISIKINKSKKKQFYYLCHEIGHFLCLNEDGYLMASEKGYSYASFTYRISKVEEEYDAWKAAESFILNENLFIDKEFEMIKALAISSYMIWAHESIYDIKRKKKVRNATQNKAGKRERLSETNPDLGSDPGRSEKSDTVSTIPSNKDL